MPPTAFQVVSFGLGHGRGLQTKDEFIVIDQTSGPWLAFMEKTFGDLLYRFAAT